MLTDRSIFDETVSGCWLWQGPVDADGYGELRKGSQCQGVHVWGYELLVGPIPDGLEPDHLCRVRSCWNPEHLEAVTHEENIRRGLWGPEATKHRAELRTHCKNGHLYDEATTSIRPNGRRRCRSCRNERYRRTGQ